MLEMFFLGPPRFLLHGRPVTGFFSSKVWLLLCYLAIERRPHAREKLASLLWGEMPEARAKANLRQALHNLQTAFPGYFSITRTTAAFDPTQPHHLDIDELHRVSTQPEVAPTQLEAVLARPQGEFLEGLAVEAAPELETWLGLERERYRLLWLSACERLTAYYAQAGQWERASQSARRMLSLDPWREASHRQLMLLLARQGEYTAAIAQYTLCRAMLEKEFGVAPALETAALYARIEQARSSQRHNLPPAPGPLVGRQAELQRLGEWLRDPQRRLITLVGPGGVGKTRLGQALAGQHIPLFLNGERYVALEAIAQPDYLLTAIAKVVEADLAGPDAPGEQLARQLSGQEVLLLLDGFEHVISEAGLIDTILQATPEVKLVVTSREKLNLRSEWVFTVAGLALPPAELPAGQAWEQYAAVECFVQYARRQQPDFILDGQGAAVAQISRTLGGSPLGLELAAALLPMATCAQIAAEVTQNLDVLTGPWGDMPERQRSLRAVFEHSWRQLAAHEQAIFPRLSVFRGGFTPEAAGRVAGATLSDLKGLAAKSLLRTASAEGEAARYDIHAILRQYAEELLARDPVRQRQTQIAHFTYYADQLHQQEAQWLLTDYQALLAAMSSELDNIRLAWAGAIAYREVNAITQILRPLHRLYEARAWLPEGLELFVRALQALRPMTTPAEQYVEGQLLSYCSTFQMYLGRMAQALESIQQGIALLRQAEAGEPLALALNVLGAIQASEGNDAAARQAYQECLTLSRRLGNHAYAVAPLTNLGLVCIHAGDYEAAKQTFEEGLAICAELDIRPARPYLLGCLGSLYIALQDWPTAKAYYEQALAANAETANLRLKIEILLDLGQINVRLGAYEQALANSQAGLALARQSDALAGQATGLLWTALAQHGLGARAAAKVSLGEGLETVLKTHAEPKILMLLIGAAILLLNENRSPLGVQLLKLVASHPAAERDNQLWARELLAEHGIRLAAGETVSAEHPLSKIAGAALSELRAKPRFGPPGLPAGVNLAQLAPQL